MAFNKILKLMLVTLLNNYGTIFGLAWSLNILKNFSLHYHPVFNHKSSDTNIILSLSLSPHTGLPCSPLDIPVLSFKGWEKECLHFLCIVKEFLTQQHSYFVYWFPFIRQHSPFLPCADRTGDFSWTQQ